MISGEFPDDCPWLTAELLQLADIKEARTPEMAWVGLKTDFSPTSDLLTGRSQPAAQYNCLRHISKYSHPDPPQRL